MLYNDKKFIGLVIKNARKKVRMTQAQLSEKISMSEKNLVNIENGKQFPRVDAFLRIIEILDISLEEFGIKLTFKNINNGRQELIKDILAASNSEINNYIEILNLVKKISK